MKLIELQYGENFKIVHVKRMKPKDNKDNVNNGNDNNKNEVNLIPTETIVVTFKGQMIPKTAITEKISYDIEMYIPRVIQ